MKRIFSFGGRVYRSAVAWTLVFAAVRSCGNLLVLPLMVRRLSQEDLGFWYVFLSLAGISALVDMGFFTSMSRAAAYLWAGAEKLERFGITPAREEVTVTREPNYRLLADLVKTMRLYYVWLALLVTAVMATFGTAWILHQSHHFMESRAILASWLLFLGAIFLNTVSGMWHPLLSGINQVRLNQQILIWGLLANYAATFLGLLLGAGLLAPVLGYLMMGLVSRIAAQVMFDRLTQATRFRRSARWSASLLTTLWPTAWRTGIVTIGIYATLNLSTLICTAFLGLKTAASFGLSLQLVLAAMSVATGFFIVKIPLIAQLQAQGRRSEISQIVFPRMRWFWAVYIALSAIAVFFGEPILRDLLHSNTPLLSRAVFTGLFFVIGLEGHHAIFRELTLTSNQNPFATPVIISGALIVCLSIILVGRIGIWGVIIAPGIVQICFNNWWTVLVGLRSIGNSAGDYISSLFNFRQGPRKA